MPTSLLPGISVAAAPLPQRSNPIRTDIAGFVGRSVRGPASGVTRLAGFDEAQASFGRLTRDANLGWTLRGYFANGGEIAYVRRVLGQGSAYASASAPAAVGEVVIAAREPGSWANGTSITIEAELDGPSVLWNWRIEVLHERAEVGVGVPTDRLVESFARLRSVHVVADVQGIADRVRSEGRQTVAVKLGGGSDGVPPTADDYDTAIKEILDLDEVSLVVLPDIRCDLDIEADRVIARTAAACDATADRMVLVDLATSPGTTVSEAAHALGRLRAELSPFGTQIGRSVAAYHPLLRVAGANERDPSIPIPATGHVAGIASRLDRERGPGRSPANVNIEDIVDLATNVTTADLAALSALQINPIRCVHGRGLQVWGARTLDADNSRFIAHRRFVHRLVRCFRGIGEALVFEANTIETRLSVERGITTVMLQAFRSGALAGASPAEAFDVRCDATTTPADIDAGRMICVTTFVLANPIERISVRLALGDQGHLEVTEL